MTGVHARARRPLGFDQGLSHLPGDQRPSHDVLRRWRHLWNNCRCWRTLSNNRIAVIGGIVLFCIVWQSNEFVVVGDLFSDMTEADPATLTCPQVYTAGAERKLIPTLEHPWPDRKLGEMDPYPAIYTAREDARKQLGPLFWAKVQDFGHDCIMVAIDATLGESLFAKDGTSLTRYSPPDPNDESKGMKFVYGDNWTRQRTVLTQEVLTDAVKQERGVYAAPIAASCILDELQKSVDTAIDLLPILRHCFALFIVTAVMGEHWEGRTALMNRLIRCEGSGCEGFASSFLSSLLEPSGSTFTCLKTLVTDETTRRLNKYYVGSVFTEDPDKESLLSRMLRLAPEAGRATSRTYLNLNEIVMNTISFVSAGWETSTITIINTMWFLASWRAFPRALEIQKKMHGEAGRGETGLSQQILRETLSWRPPIPWHGGDTKGVLEAELHNTTYRIPPNTRVVVDILATHKLTGGPVGSWDPERQGSIEEHAGGLGGRHCPGGKVVRHGIVFLLNDIFRDFKIVLENPEDVEGWLQSYTGNLEYDLCAIMFNTPLKVIPSRVSENRDTMRSDSGASPKF